jgi:predicted transporter
MSLLAVFALAAMTVAPRPGAESLRVATMLVVAVFFVVWLGVGLWVRARWRADSRPPPPVWLTQVLLCAGVVYLLGVFLLIAA